MFGYVTASLGEMTPEQQERYGGVYCGICRSIKAQASQAARLGLSYDITFLSLLLMSLYEPEEETGRNHCILHPKRRNWIENEYVRYGADMNVALAYYNCLDDWQDDGKRAAKIMANILGRSCPAIEEKYPRQCGAIRDCITELSRLEKAGCANPDEPANCFGRLMAELMVYREDLWADSLRALGFHLGRFIYLADAAVDYRKDKKKGKYNPFIAMGSDENWARWEEYLVLALGQCTRAYEMLPLVQDKDILDNILYSGVWCSLNRERKKAEDET